MEGPHGSYLAVRPHQMSFCAQAIFAPRRACERRDVVCIRCFADRPDVRHLGAISPRRLARKGVSCQGRLSMTPGSEVAMSDYSDQVGRIKEKLGLARSCDPELKVLAPPAINTFCIRPSASKKLWPSKSNMIWSYPTVTGRSSSGSAMVACPKVDPARGPITEFIR